MSLITIDEIVNTVTISEDGNTVTVAAQIPSLGYGLTGSFLTGEQVDVALTTASVTLASTTAFTATFTTVAGMSLTLAAGTWLITAHASVGATNLGATLANSFPYGIRLYDGTTALASCHGFVPTSAFNASQLSGSSLSVVATVAASTTVSLQGAASASILLSFYANEQGSAVAAPGATKLTAVRLA